MRAKQKLQITLTILSFLFLSFMVVPGFAKADTITQTLYTPELRSVGSSPPVNSTLSFNQFNTTLANGNFGILNSVLITVGGQVLADFSLMNTSDTSIRISQSTITGTLLLSLAGTNIVTLGDDFHNWVGISKIDVAPQATYTTTKLSPLLSDSTTLTDAGNLSLFTGTGSVDLFAYTDLIVLTGISGGTDYIISTQAWAQEAVTITYDYTDSGSPAVPEPATLLLVGGGMVAAALFRRKKGEVE